MNLQRKTVGIAQGPEMLSRYVVLVEWRTKSTLLEDLKQCFCRLGRN